ncbi:MAG: UbiA family prenyltransferase, partial [Phycisphaerae bacterium]
LQYRPEVVDFIKAQRALGRPVFLTTASHIQLAQAVADHLELFDEVLATTATNNLSGASKLAAIQERLGAAPFDYIGDSAADLPLCRAAQQAYVVEPAGSLLRALGPAYDPARQFGTRGGKLQAWIKALRPMQWSKNLLIFVPLMTAHKITNHAMLLQVLLAFLVFGLSASAVYLLNDLLDIEADRQHPRKRFRPLAAGRLSIPAAIATSGFLFAASLVLSVALLPKLFLLTLVAYIAVTTLYSLWIKRRLLLDVIVLAGLYTVRIVAGGAAVGVTISEYLLAFSMFLFLSLAFMKRYTELLIMQDRSQRESRGRSYITDDLGLIETVGPASGYMAVLVFTLYISFISGPMAPEKLYKHPICLWAVCPILLYWITRVWFLARRRQFADDPIAFALRDRVSLIAGALAVAAVLLASL